MTPRPLTHPLRSVLSVLPLLIAACSSMNAAPSDTSTPALDAAPTDTSVPPRDVAVIETSARDAIADAPDAQAPDALTPDAGDGAVTGRPVPQSPVVQLSLGQTHACALLQDHTVRCWGHNSYGQLGDGSTRASAGVPVQVMAVDDAVQLSAGGDHNCVRRMNGAVKCWGYNHDGQLGDGSHTARNVAVDVGGVSTATEVFASSTRSCARLMDGTFVCWLTAVPETVAAPQNTIDLAIGDYQTCFLTTARLALCVGSHNEAGQLGDGTTATRMFSTDWREVMQGTDVTSMVAAVDDACVLRTGGTVRCWGKNTDGQIGDGTHANALVATTVLNVTGATQVVHGGGHGCALLADRTVTCWGDDYYGQLGDGASMTTHATAVPVADLTGVVELAAGLYETCARRTDGTVWCWGQNLYFQLGDGTQTERHRPVQVRW